MLVPGKLMQSNKCLLCIYWVDFNAINGLIYNIIMVNWKIKFVVTSFIRFTVFFMGFAWN